jgi:outer membrane protein assembly factor BamA
LLLFFALVVLLPVKLVSQSAEGSDSARTAQSGIYPLPIFFYTPETGFAGGAAAMYIRRDSAVPRASSLSANFIYTQRKQIITSLGGDLYFHNGSSRLLGDLTFQRYPNKFFGVGNATSELNEETYTPESFSFRAVFYRTILTNVFVGPTVRYEHVSLREVDTVGILRFGQIPGSKGSTSTGLGLVANWDSRDNTFAARSGSFYQMSLIFYRRAFGGDHSYVDLLIDTRQFFEMTPGHVLALQVAGEFIGGSAPFQSLARFGGPNFMRGYFEGRYRDKNGVGAQLEYRFPVWWRFGLVGFGGLAQVADQISNLSVGRFWLAGGMGLRFALNPEERISLRLDYGVGNNASGFYINVTEAF